MAGANDYSRQDFANADVERTSGVNVLIVTRSGDNETTQWVAEAIGNRGHTAIRLDTDLFPHRVRLSTCFTNERISRNLVTEDGVSDLGEIAAVYCRRYATGMWLPRELGDTRPACVKESSWTLMGMLSALKCFQLDPIARVRRADYKELQYSVAVQIGLDVPRTLFSNDPAKVREFASESGALVTKVQSKFIIHREGAEQVIFTSPVSTYDLAELDSLVYCPMIFQEEVEKELELRATVIGRKIFTASIDTRSSEEGHVDWRKDESLSVGWRPYTLPSDVEEKLLRLVRCFGLNYSAADFILTPDGRHVFLEINPAGEWAWLARDLGLPIADAVAEVLLCPHARLVEEPLVEA